MCEDEELENDRESWDYDSGPFCQHWGDPSDCEHTCENCGYMCKDHDNSPDCDEFVN